MSIEKLQKLGIHPGDIKAEKMYNEYLESD